MKKKRHLCSWYSFAVMARDRGLDEEEEEDEEGGEELMDDFDAADDQLCPTEVVLVVKGRRIRVDRFFILFHNLTNPKPHDYEPGRDWR